MQGNKVIKVLAVCLFIMLISAFVGYRSTSPVYRPNYAAVNDSLEYEAIYGIDTSEYEVFFEVDTTKKKKDSVRTNPAMLYTSKSMIATNPIIKFKKKRAPTLRVKKKTNKPESKK